MELLRAETGWDTRQLINLLIMIMTFSGVFGFIYELLFYKIDTGRFIKRGSSYGPWIPIYVFGGAAYTLLVCDRLGFVQRVPYQAMGLQHGDLEFRQY